MSYIKLPLDDDITLKNFLRKCLFELDFCLSGVQLPGWVLINEVSP